MRYIRKIILRVLTMFCQVLTIDACGQALSADKMNFTVHWYVNESHQINDDCRGQVGCLMTMGKGDIQRAAYHNLSHVNSIVVIPEEKSFPAGVFITSKLLL